MVLSIYIRRRSIELFPLVREKCNSISCCYNLYSLRQKHRYRNMLKAASEAGIPAKRMKGDDEEKTTEEDEEDEEPEIIGEDMPAPENEL